MSASVLIQFDEPMQRPEVFIDGRKLDLASVRRIEFCYVPGQGSSIAVEYAVGSSHNQGAGHV